MLSRSSQKLRRIIIAEFTKQLILNYGAQRGIKTDNKKIVRKEVAKILKKEKEIGTAPQTNPKKILHRIKPLPKPQFLIIPETKLPPHLQYLRPTPTQKEIELGKLDPLIKDPIIKAIECQGPDKPIIVHTPTKKTTKIALSKEEIDEVINKFSYAAKIPIEEGVIKIVAGKLVLSAIVSDIVGSKFLIKKMMYQPIFR
jgi:hypothetical protein